MSQDVVLTALQYSLQIGEYITLVLLQFGLLSHCANVSGILIGHLVHCANFSGLLCQFSKKDY